MIRSLILLTLALAAANPTLAIVIRHDRPDSLYRVPHADYPAICTVGGAMGTLVAPRWVLTAGHVVSGVTPGMDAVRFGDRPVRIAALAVHPDYLVEERHRDLALVLLAEPVEDIAPVPLYRDADEAGREVRFVGTGVTGTGLTGPTTDDRVLRAATNTVLRADPGWLRFRFDEPPAGTDLEGISGPGDSGGPALIDTGDGGRVAGVSAYNDGQPECRYGSGEHYTRVSTELAWIDSVMAHGAELEAAAALPPDVTRLDPAARAAARRTADALLTCFAEQDALGFRGLFRDDLWEESAAAGDPLDGSLQFLGSVIEARGPITGAHPLPDRGIVVPDSEFPMIPVTFHFADGMAGYVGMCLDDEGLLDHYSVFVKEGICREPAPCPRAVDREAFRTGD